MRTKNADIGWLRFGLVATLLCCCCLSAGVSDALADPIWSVLSRHGGQVLPFGDGDATTAEGQYVIQAYNDGDVDADGSGADPIVVNDTLPAGVQAIDGFGNGWDCTSFTTFPASTVTCERTDVIAAPAPFFLTRGSVRPLTIPVSVDPGPVASGTNTATISGGGAPAPASSTDPTSFGTTPAGFGIVSGSLLADAFDGPGIGGLPVRQAGAHPSEIRVNFDMNLKYTSDTARGGPYTEPDGWMRNVSVKLPAGTIGNPQATPQCPVQAYLAGLLTLGTECPASTQVGSVDLIINNGPAVVSNQGANDIALYNLVPPAGVVAAFGFLLQGVPVVITASLDPADNYSIVATVHNTPTLTPVRDVRMRLWGIPAAASHDAQRFNPNGGLNAFGVSSTGSSEPFLTLPSRCGVDGALSMQMNSWQHPDQHISVQTEPVQTTGCEKQQFDASIRAQPTTLTPAAPSGLSFDLTVPQDLAPNELGTPPLRTAAVTLPVGMTVSPASADGLAACTLVQIKLETNEPPSCPDASKIGTVELTTPLLASPVDGSVYLAAQTDNPFGSLLALYVVVRDDQRGLMIKLPGRVETNPVTGQVTTTFADNPQVPFSNLHLEFKDGSRAPLSTPPTCGVKTVSADLTSWNASLPAVHATSAFLISKDGAGAPCGRPPFNPTLKAGTTNPVGGTDSPLSTTITRPDGDQELSKVDVTMPAGVLGRIANVDVCSNKDADAGACGAGALIGKATVAAGPGLTPFYITDGKVFITEGYKGAPFGLAILVHAKAGPLDLGNVIVRGQVQVDRHTALLRVVTDPLPTILSGIPLQLRIANVLIDRPGFTFNPTSCTEKNATGEITSTTGAVAQVNDRFQVAGCSRLGFDPIFSISVGGKGHTKAGGSTPLTATLQMRKGQANIKGVKVALPLTLNALLPVVTSACTLAEFNSGKCAKARAGSAVAVTPLLDKPLRGSVYFVKNGHPLPDLMVALRGQVDFDLDGRVQIPKDNRLVTNFDTVPDVPISKFSLALVAGKHGPVGVAENLCTHQLAEAQMSFKAQNGKVVRRSQFLHIAGCGHKHSKAGHR